MVEEKQEEQERERPTMDPTLFQLMQTLVSNGAALQRAQQIMALQERILVECRELLEKNKIALPEGMLPSENGKKKKVTRVKG